jgi:hypothetical protein
MGMGALAVEEGASEMNWVGRGFPAAKLPRSLMGDGAKTARPGETRFWAWRQ